MFICGHVGTPAALTVEVWLHHISDPSTCCWQLEETIPQILFYYVYTPLWPVSVCVCVCGWAGWHLRMHDVVFLLLIDR